MPRPLFILCAESLSFDRFSGLVSVFQILEGYSYLIDTRGTGKLLSSINPDQIANAMPFPSMSFFGLAAWMRLDGESPDTEYEYELAVDGPGEPEKKVTSGKFKFSKLTHRFRCRIVRSTPWPQDGMLRFISRIRPAGTTEWMSQDYPMPIDRRVISDEGDPPPQGQVAE